MTRRCLTRRCSRPAAADAVQLATQRPAAGLLNGRVVRPAAGTLVSGLLAGAVSLGFTGCEQEHTPVAKPAPAAVLEAPVASAEELAVYAALLNTVFLHDGTSKLVVRSERVINAFAIPELVPEQSLRSALQSAQSVAGPFPSSVHTAVPLVIVSPEILAETTARNWGSEWEPFFRAYPGAAGIITFSAVGVDSVSGMALVTFTFECGTLCGGAGYYVLKQEHGQWVVARGGQVRDD